MLKIYPILNWLQKQSMAQSLIFKDGSILIWLKAESIGITIVEPIEKNKSLLS